MEVHSISRFKFQSVAILAPLTSLSYSLFFVIYFLNRFHRDGPFAVSMSLCKIGAHYNSCSFSIMVKGMVNWFILRNLHLSGQSTFALLIMTPCYYRHPTTDAQHKTDPRQNISRPWLKKKTLLLRTLDLKDSRNRQFSRIAADPVHTLTFSFESAYISMRIGLSVHTNTPSVFIENALIWKRSWK